MRWYKRLNHKLAWSWDPSPDISIPPQEEQLQEPAAAVLPSHETVTKRDKIKPGKRKKKIRQVPFGQALGPQLPGPASDLQNIRGQ